MRLTEQEQQEIIRFVEAGKPLPDKYRFLLFDDKREVELVWNGKTNDVSNVVLPFQTIEQVDEPRSEKHETSDAQGSLFSTDVRGRQLKGWTNKLIWGDNKLILSSLKNGPMREEIERQGGIKLVYIDPPFDVGADFSMDIEIGEETFTKEASILEEIAYRDTWGRGADSFVSMLYERLILIRDLMAPDGSIYLHIGPQVGSLVKVLMDEVFGVQNFRNNIRWRRMSISGFKGKKKIPFNHETIFKYSKSENLLSTLNILNTLRNISRDSVTGMLMAGSFEQTKTSAPQRHQKPLNRCVGMIWFTKARMGNSTGSSI